MTGMIRRIAGKVFRSLMPELLALDEYRDRHRKLLHTQIDPRVKLLPPSLIFNASIGRYTYVSENSLISHATIGNFCSIGPNFLCGYGVHPLNGISTSPMFYSTLKQNGYSLTQTDKIEERKEISIGHDVFIGMNVTILDGVTIGNGAVIGAGTVVAKDVEPYTIVAGNPMRVLRKRFDEQTIAQMQELEWWHWGDERLPEIEQNFFSPEQFVEKALKKK